MFECIDDDNVASQLFECAETWLSGFGCELIRGPFSLSINQESRMLVDGFEKSPFIMMGHARKYFQALVTGAGYTKAKDLYAWFFNTDFNNPPAMQRLIDRYNDRIMIRDLDKKNFDRDMNVMLNIFNNSWANNWGFIPFTENEFHHMGKEIIQLIPVEQIKIAHLDDQTDGMKAKIPKINENIKDLK